MKALVRHDHNVDRVKSGHTGAEKYPEAEPSIYLGIRCSKVIAYTRSSHGDVSPEDLQQPNKDYDHRQQWIVDEEGTT